MSGKSLAGPSPGSSSSGTTENALAAWAAHTGRPTKQPDADCLRFAFYGRVSTEDWQDPVMSRARQHDQAAALVAGHGRIMAEFFDIGYSRTLPWARRPQATALVTALANPDRGWDAIVIGHSVVSGEQVHTSSPLGSALARVLPDRVGHSWFSAVRMPVCACWPSRSKAGLSSGARRRDGPLKVNSAV